MCDAADLSHDHAVRADGRFLAGVRHLEHMDRRAECAQRITQLVSQRRQEFVFGAAVALGAVAGAVGFEELGHVGHDQVPAIAVG